MNDIASILIELQEQATRPYFAWLNVLDMGEHFIKARLYVRQDIFIQVYRNDQTQLTNFVLILGGQRVYGRDEIGGIWHRHPFDDPVQHDRSDEGSKALTLSEFIEEVMEILTELELL